MRSSPASPGTPPVQQVIEAYGDGGFRISGVAYRNSVLVASARTVAWAAESMADITLESLEPVIASEPRPEILLIGCGPRISAPPPGLRQALREAGIALELMDTGAACRTYNVLVAEERRVAAALIAIA